MSQNEISNLLTRLGNEIAQRIGQLFGEFQQNGLTINIGLGRQVRIALAILATLLSGIFISLLSILLQGRYLSPWLIVIISLVIGLLVYFLIM